MKHDFRTFYKDKRFYIPIIFLIVFELFLQAGFYKPLLKKNSYAANVNRITDHIISKKKEFDPDVLVLGTSVAYQGLSVRILNEYLIESGHKLSSAAVPGSELIVQEKVLKKVLSQFNNVKYIIYVAEVTMPWVAQDELSIPTLSMLSELDRFGSLRSINDFEYKVKNENLFFMLIKSISYRRDMRDLFLDPGKRLKHLTRSIQNPNREFWDYENNQLQKITPYKVLNLADCKVKTAPSNQDPIPVGSDVEHKIALYKTCDLAQITTTETKETEKTKLYFRRLKKIYDFAHSKNIKFITVLAPYSETIQFLGGSERAQFWKEELGKFTNTAEEPFIDLQRILDGPKNGDYCYDMIHLNAYGMQEFSKSLGAYLKGFFSKK